MSQCPSSLWVERVANSKSFLQKPEKNFAEVFLLVFVGVFERKKPLT
jgi:hypothetical protein